MPTPLFLVSAPRSGSTFLRGALDAHAEVSLTSESGWVAFLRKAELLATTPAADPVDDGEGFRTFGVLAVRYREALTEAFAASVRAFVETFRRAATPDARYFGDKVHSHNDAAFLLRWFGDLRLVYLVRDVRDVLVSSYSFQEQQRTGWEAASFETRCTALATFFTEMAALLRDREHVVVRYEDLVTDPMREVARILTSLGLELTPDVEQWLAADARVLFSNHGTSPSPAASVGRWQALLDDDQKATAQRLLGPQLRALGYG